MSAVSFDAIVVGLGAMGSATTWALARRGVRVLGLDQFQPGHVRGSSHGESRIIRQLYFEHPLYVPIVQRAYALWAELETEAGAQLLYLNGGLTLGPAGGRIVPGARDAARRHGLSFDELTADGITRRFPAIHPPENYVGLWDPRGGYVRADRAVASFQSVAQQHGASLHFGEPMVRWRADGAGVTIDTPQAQYRADHLVLCVGAWADRIVADLSLPLVVERQVLVWFDPPASPDQFDAARFPIFVYEYRTGHTAYGFPRLEQGVKAAVFHGGEMVPNPDAIQAPVTGAEIQVVRDALASAFPALGTAPVRATMTCLFTNAPDSRFVIGRHPAHSQVLLCSSCSGHGFKFAPAIGEINADLLTRGASQFDLTPFEVTRFMGGP